MGVDVFVGLLIEECPRGKGNSLELERSLVVPVRIRWRHGDEDPE